MQRWRLELSGDHRVQATPVSGAGERNPNATGQAGTTGNQEGTASSSRGQSGQQHGARSGSYILGRDILCLAFRDAGSHSGSQTGSGTGSQGAGAGRSDSQRGTGAARSDSQRGTDAGRSDSQRAGQSGRSADQSAESRTGGQGHGMSGDRFIVVLRKGSAGQFQQNNTGTNR